MSKNPLTIGNLASACGVNIETIRYYQRLGLISEPPKPVSGYRVYTQETVTRVRFIKRAQQLGFSLQEIDELLQLSEGACQDVRIRAEAKRQQIEAQIRDLMALRTTLDNLIDACHNENDSINCPIVQSLNQNETD